MVVLQLSRTLLQSSRVFLLEPHMNCCRAQARKSQNTAPVVQGHSDMCSLKKIGLMGCILKEPICQKTISVGALKQLKAVTKAVHVHDYQSALLTFMPYCCSKERAALMWSPAELKRHVWVLQRANMSMHHICICGCTEEPKAVTKRTNSSGQPTSNLAIHLIHELHLLAFCWPPSTRSSVPSLHLQCLSNDPQ